MNLDKFEKGPREIFHPEIQKVTECYASSWYLFDHSVRLAWTAHQFLSLRYEPNQKGYGALKAIIIKNLTAEILICQVGVGICIFSKVA